jgi:hypothetical protein
LFGHPLRLEVKLRPEFQSFGEDDDKKNDQQYIQHNKNKAHAPKSSFPRKIAKKIYN